MTNGHNDDYEEGKRDGRLDALEHRVNTHDRVRDNHERRLIYLERIVWGIFGVITISTLWPKIETVFKALSE